MQLQLASLALFALGATALPTTAAPSDGFVGTIGPFSLKISTANSSLNNKFLGRTSDPTDSSRSLVSISDAPDRSFFWVPNSANPVPPGGQLPQGTLLYEVKFHTAAYNLTMDLAQWDSENLVTPVIMINSSETGSSYAHAAAFSRPCVAFLNDKSQFLGCRGDSPTSDDYTLKWQTNLEPGHSGQVGLKCADVIVSMV